MPGAHSFRLCIGIIGAFIMVMALLGCASSQSKEDPEIVALRKDLSQIGQLNAANQEKMKQICDDVHGLLAQVEKLEKTLNEVAGRLDPIAPTTMTSTKQEPLPSKVAPNAETASVKTRSAPRKKATKRRTETGTSKPGSNKVQSPSKLLPLQEYEKAHKAYKNHRYDDALALFKSFVQRYPNHDLSDNAQYWLGEVHYDTEDYPNAILAFKDVVTRYGDENKAPDALLKIGYAYIALDDPVNARVFLRRLIKNYPFSESVAKAQAKLKELENL